MTLILGFFMIGFGLGWIACLFVVERFEKREWERRRRESMGLKS